MKVSATQPFQIIYSLYQHEYLGILFESYIVQLDDKGRLTFRNQNISSKNAREFAKGLDQRDYDLIELMDGMAPDHVLRHFGKKNLKPSEYFPKLYDPKKGDELLQEQIEAYMERRRASILEKLKGKQLFEMGNDGEPTHKKIEIPDERASIKFHFSRNETQTTYYPTIQHEGKKIEITSPGSYLVCRNPGWIVIGNVLYGFQHPIDGKKLQPFLNKKMVVVPRNLEESFYERFLPQLVATFDDIEAIGFTIDQTPLDAHPLLTMSELATVDRSSNLFGEKPEPGVPDDESGKIFYDLSFRYGKHVFRGDGGAPVSVTLEKTEDSYIFHRVRRDLEAEKKYAQTLNKLGLPLKPFRCSVEKSHAFSWLNENRVNLLNLGFEISQPRNNDKKYFVGKAVIDLEVKENIDWFDIHATIRFGEFEISFKELRKLILKKKVEFKLPNGEIAIIPEAWLVKYGDLFALSQSEQDTERPVLRKHHFSLLRDLQENNLAKVQMSDRIRSIDNFTGIKNYDLPPGFLGELRPYQKVGYNWLRFLNEFGLGGCLADDMGLGKTVQTLALLMWESQKEDPGTSLIIMPTSLIYNWEMEASKFAPSMKILNYTGSNRKKDVVGFGRYDVVITSYGITRLDIELLAKFKFNYIILDESQVIKNPTSNISKAVMQLQSRYKLTLTGTPLENTTMDLWSQMTFINPGLLGGQTFFRNEFLTPIEKKGDEQKAKKLHAIIKPFILRRLKSQVATDLPEKTENVHYTNMTPDQEKKYEEVKAMYRERILTEIDKQGIGNTKMTLLEGLTRLRQISNHPRMVDISYTGDSGKMEDLSHMLENAIAEGHKLLVFSQFVKHLELVKDKLRSLKIQYCYLDGSSVDRKEQVERFTKDETVRVFLISIKAGGLGLNLTQADYVFILDPWWNPAVEQQAVDRAYRIGQKKKVFTYRFITKNTVEEKILQLQKRKQKLSDTLITTEENIIKSLTREDIEMLLA
ncbi:MAG: DEAD/DEAH box helicase [Cyclobacteriaceae bacterium]